MSNDLISRNKVLDVLEKVFDDYRMAWRPEDEKYGFAYAVPRAIMNIKSEELSTGWIPVEARLPDTDDYILLSFSNSTLPDIGRYEQDETGGAFYLGDEDESCVKMGFFVNAWMTLPKPYRPEVMPYIPDQHICTTCRHRGMSKKHPGEYACWNNPTKENPTKQGNASCVSWADIPYGMRMEKEMGN